MNNKDYIENLLARMTKAKIEAHQEPFLFVSDVVSAIEKELKSCLDILNQGNKFDSGIERETRRCLNMLYLEGKVIKDGNNINGVDRLKYLLTNNNN